MSVRRAAGPAALVAALVAGTALLFSPAVGFGFLNYDDDVYVTANPHVRAGLAAPSLAWALTRPQSGNYHPVTMLSHMLDVELFGLDPHGHHAVNIGLHAANVALLFAFLLALTGRPVPSALAAALFAVHPLQVQSVAWVAERKNLLSTAFWFGALWAYVGYLRRPGPARYGGVFGLAVLALLAKPMAVTLPLTLLLVDHAVHRGFTRPLTALPLRRAVYGKVPLVAASALVGALTVWAQAAHGAMPSATAYPAGTRIAHGVSAYAWYLERAVWPAGLAAFYPYPAALEPLSIVAAAAILGGITFAIAWKGRGVPYASFGWAWYALTLAPVVGIVQVGVQAWADRYAYVPLVGVFVATVFAADAGLRRLGRPARAAGVAACLVVVGLLAWRARVELRPWHDSAALFSRAVAVTAPNAIAYDNLGMALVERGDLDGALASFRSAVAADPGSASAQMNLANALAVTGDRDGAIDRYDRAARLAPDDARIPANAGRVLLDAGRPRAALVWLDRAAALDPDLAGVRTTRGLALLAVDRTDEARNELARAVAADPGDVDARLALARALVALGRRAEAVRELEDGRARAGDPAARARFDRALAGLR